MANYCVYSGRTGTSTGTVAGNVPTSGEWDTAFVSLNECQTTATLAAGDVIFVAHDHSYNYGVSATITMDGVPVYVISIDRANTTTATPVAGALETTGASASYNFNVFGYVYGMTLQGGSGASQGGANIVISNSGTDSSDSALVLDTCTFHINSTNATPTITVGQADTSTERNTVVCNCKAKFGNVSQVWRLTGASHTRLIGCSIDNGGTAPTTLFQFGGRGGSTVELTSCDFSGATNLVNPNNIDEPSVLRAANCKVPASVVSATPTSLYGMCLELMTCSSSDRIYDYYWANGNGTVVQSTSIYLTTSPSQTKDQDGSLISYSMKLDSLSLASLRMPLYSPWVSVFVGSTGSKTISMKVAYDNATALKDTECFIEVEYYGSTSTPQSTTETSAPVVSGTVSRNLCTALFAGSTLSDTSAGWTGTSGWTNKKTHTLSKTVTVNQQGYVRARIALAKATTTIYVDNTVTVA